MLKKFLSRKLLVVVLSNVFAGVLVTNGIQVDETVITEATDAIVSSGSIAEAGEVILKTAIILGQAWVTGRYIKAQALVDSAVAES